MRQCQRARAERGLHGGTRSALRPCDMILRLRELRGLWAARHPSARPAALLPLWQGRREGSCHLLPFSTFSCLPLGCIVLTFLLLVKFALYTSLNKTLSHVRVIQAADVRFFISPCHLRRTQSGSLTRDFGRPGSFVLSPSISQSAWRRGVPPPQPPLACCDPAVRLPAPSPAGVLPLLAALSLTPARVFLPTSRVTDGSRTRGRPGRRWADPAKGRRLRLQEPSRAAEDGTLWPALICGVAGVNGGSHPLNCRGAETWPLGWPRGGGAVALCSPCDRPVALL